MGFSVTNKSVIIRCAGKGTRLGAGKPKALIDILGKPLIIRQLELLNDVEDIRVIVGYQAENVIEIVHSYRKDITILYNNDYLTTGTAASFSKGLVNAREYAVALDGDLLVHPEDMKALLAMQDEVIGGCEPTTDNPVLMNINYKNEVIEFSREHGSLEWTGLAQIKANHLAAGTHHVYHLLEPLLPVKVIKIRTKEIDTENDYNNALNWVRHNYS